MPYPIIISVAAVLFIVILAMSYVKAPTDKYFIISGLRRRPKFVSGKSALRIPFLQRIDKLDLKMISVDVKTKEDVPTNEYINVMVDSAVKLKVGTTEDMREKASMNFLNKNEEYIKNSVVDVLEGNVREIIGQMKLTEIVTDRKAFAQKVQDNAAPDMARMGLELISFNVQNVTDRNGVIENLGIDQIVTISKAAAISRAESERDVEVAKAQAAKEANDAKVASEQEIAIKQNELNIKRAELKKAADLKQAEADAAYNIQEQEQRKTIEITTADANIAKQEKEIELKQKEIEVTVRTLDANVKKKAEAEKYAAQQKAEAELYIKQKAAEAEAYKVKQEAEAKKAQAEADKYAKLQDAEGVKAVGLAEAAAIQAKAEAEAAGIDKKAEAMKKYGEAAILEMYFKALPDVAKNVAEPLSKVDKITMYGDGNSTKMVGDITDTMTKVMSGLQESTGIDVASLISGFIGGRAASPKESHETIIHDSAPVSTPITAPVINKPVIIPDTSTDNNSSDSIE